MKVALSTQQVKPVYPGKPLYTQPSASAHQKQKEGTNVKEEFSQIDVKERTDGYKTAQARAMALYNDKHTEPELNSDHFDNKRGVIRRIKQPPRILDLTI